MLRQLRASAVILAILTLLTGAVYPCLVTAIAQLAFPFQANGSILESDGNAVGSELIGQSFSRPEYYWGRLSATASHPYNAAASGGSNLGPLHPDLTKQAAARLQDLRWHDPQAETIPVDLATASGSGLDPHISPAAAEAQVRHVAAARNMPEDAVREIVRRSSEPRQFGILGEPRVNVLRLNLSLDAISSAGGSGLGTGPFFGRVTRPSSDDVSRRMDLSPSSAPASGRLSSAGGSGDNR